MKSLLTLGALALALAGCATEGNTQVAQAECKIYPITTTSVTGNKPDVDSIHQSAAQADLGTSSYRFTATLRATAPPAATSKTSCATATAEKPGTDLNYRMLIIAAGLSRSQVVSSSATLSVIAGSWGPGHLAHLRQRREAGHEGREQQRAHAGEQHRRAQAEVLPDPAAREAAQRRRRHREADHRRGHAAQQPVGRHRLSQREIVDEEDHRREVEQEEPAAEEHRRQPVGPRSKAITSHATPVPADRPASWGPCRSARSAAP